MAKGLESAGVTLSVSSGSPTEFAAIGNIMSIKGTGATAGVVDITNVEDTSSRKLMDLPDEGQVTIELNYDPDNATHALLRSARRNRTKLEFQILMPGDAITFLGFVISVALTTNVDAPVKANVTIEITGEGIAIPTIPLPAGAGISGGSGYVYGDLLTVVGGVGAPAVFVYGDGIVFPGAYTVLPTSPAATTGGHGTGAMLSFAGPPPGNLTLVASTPGDLLRVGFADGVYGSLTPNVFLGGTVSSLFTLQSTEPPLVYTELNVVGTFAQDAFTSITIGDVTLLSASAEFGAGGGSTTWDWGDAVLIPAEGTYTVEIV